NDLANAKEGVYTYKINREHYHQMGSLIPDKGQDPKFAQIYFCDTYDNQLKRKHEIIKKELYYELLDELQFELSDNNPFVQTFRCARNSEIKTKQEIGDLYDLPEPEKEEELQKTILFDTLLETYSKEKSSLTQLLEDATIESSASFISISETKEEKQQQSESENSSD
ncbi:10628_t:CDS:2, partial [Dentiscutata erythropus]